MMTAWNSGTRFLYGIAVVFNVKCDCEKKRKVKNVIQHTRTRFLSPFTLECKIEQQCDRFRRHTLGALFAFIPTDTDRI
jgi:hypothetical protein